MSNRDLLVASERRSLMFSWVAYLEDQSEEDRLKYIASAMKGIALVDEEMTRRGIGTCS
jgi:hypothetical protein